MGVKQLGDNHDLKELLHDYEKSIIKAALQKYLGDKKKVAKKLGIKLSTLYNKISKYDLK